MSVIKADDNINDIITNNSLTEEQFDILLNQTINSDILEISSLQFNISTDHSKDLEIFEPPETSFEKIKQELNEMNFFEESNENQFQEYNDMESLENIDINLDLLNDKILNSDFKKNLNEIPSTMNSHTMDISNDNIISVNNSNNINNVSIESTKDNINSIKINTNANTTSNITPTSSPNTTTTITTTSTYNNSNNNNDNDTNINYKNNNDSNLSIKESCISKASTGEFLNSELNDNSFHDITKIENRKSLIEIFKENKSIDSIQNITVNNSLNLSTN